MGLLSSFIGSIGSCIGSVVSSAARFVGGIAKGAGKVLGSLGGAIGAIGTKASGFLGGVISTLSTVLTPVLGPLAPIVTSIVVDVLTNVLISVLTPKGEKEMDLEEVEEYGAYLKESENHPEWKGADEFNNGLEHLAYLKQQAAESNIKVDKAKKLSIESLNRRSLGMAALWDRLEKQEKLEITSDFLIFAGLKGFDAEQFKSILDTSKALGYTTVPYMDFKDGNMNLESYEAFNQEMIKRLIDLKLSLGEELSLGDAYALSREMQEPLTEEHIDQTVNDDFKKYEDLGENLYNVDELRQEYVENNLPEEVDILDRNVEEDRKAKYGY